MLGSTAVYALQLGCVVSGALLAWRRPEHRPLAALLALGLAVDVALELALPFGVRVALGTCYPWAAWAVARGVLRAPEEDATQGAEPRAKSFVRLVPRLRQKAKIGRDPSAEPSPEHGSGEQAGDEPKRCVHAPILLAYALFVCAVLATGVRGPALARCYAAAQLVVAIGCGAAVWRRRKGGGPGGAPNIRRDLRRVGASAGRSCRCTPGMGEPYASRPLSATTACALVVAFVEMAQPPAYLLLPSWTSGRAVYAFGFLVVLAVQAVALAQARQRQ